MSMFVTIDDRIVHHFSQADPSKEVLVMLASPEAHTEIGDPIEIVTTRVGRIKPGGSAACPSSAYIMYNIK